MFKVFTLVVLLFSFQAIAQDEALAMGMKTKEIVRLKLWYEGLEIGEPQEIKDEADTAAQPQMNEQLARPLSSIDV